MKHPFQKSPIPESKAFVIKTLDDPFFDPNWHFHPEYQLFVVLEGHGTRFVGDSIKSFRSGDMVFTGPNLPHLWRSHEVYMQKEPMLPTRGLVIYFQENFLGQALLEKEEMEPLKQLFLMSGRGLEITGYTNKKVTRMMEDLTKMTGLNSIIQLLRILETLAHSPDLHYLAQAGYYNNHKEAEAPRMNKVHKYVMDNFRQKISLDEVASLASMTPTSFSRYFKTRANKSFSTFVSEIRVGHACKLLHDTEMNSMQVCYASGFNTLSNFNRQFKEITGTCPQQYKEEYFKTRIN